MTKTKLEQKQKWMFNFGEFDLEFDNLRRLAYSLETSPDRYTITPQGSRAVSVYSNKGQLTRMLSNLDQMKRDHLAVSFMNRYKDRAPPKYHQHSKKLLEAIDEVHQLIVLLKLRS